MKQTIVFDFDGVIHSYKSGWMGETTIADEPTNGIKEALQEIKEHGYEVVIVSTRCRTEQGKMAIAEEQRASLEGAFCAEIRDTPAADVAPLAHGKPVVRNRPEFYKKYEAVGWSEEGERLYIRHVILDDKKTVEYCPVCAKRLCSRFNNYCPNCGAKMIKED